MNYLFWNVNKNENINEILLKIIKKYDCDVIALAEYEDDAMELIEALVEYEIYLYEIPKIGCERLTILTKYTSNKIQHLSETDHYTLKLIPHESLGNQIIAFVHLPSKLYKSEYEQTMKMVSLSRDIEREEISNKTNNTIIVGDFNINPFEQGMISANACHALACRKITAKIKRKVDGQEYKLFYNPMWNLMGDSHYPPGTYYYNKAGLENYYWHIFDQVVIRPNIVEYFDFDKLKIINQVDEINLLTEKGIPVSSISDHLPITFTIN